MYSQNKAFLAFFVLLIWINLAFSNINILFSIKEHFFNTIFFLNIGVLTENTD